LVGRIAENVRKLIRAAIKRVIAFVKV